MATKQQLVNKANKANVKIEVDFGDEYVVVMMDAWNQNFADGDHGMTASGDTAKEAYDDAIYLISTLNPCTIQNCTDKFHN